MKLFEEEHYVPKWEVDIMIHITDYRTIIPMLRKYCSDNKFDWWVYNNMVYITNENIKLSWHFVDKENAMQFELAWG